MTFHLNIGAETSRYIDLCVFNFCQIQTCFHTPHHTVKIKGTYRYGRASLIAKSVKDLPAVQETQVRSLSREGPLEKEMAIPSSILAWRIPWTEPPPGHVPKQAY